MKIMLVACTMIAPLIGSVAYGDGSCAMAKLLASDGEAEDRFGFSVAISGDAAVNGAYGDDDLGDWSGAAYVYQYDGAAWHETAKLHASDGAEGDWFGRSVAIDGDVILVGAVAADSEQCWNGGAVYAFRRQGSSWVEESKIVASDCATWARFSTVAICGDVAVVGAETGFANGSYSGVAYIFRHDGSGWAEEAKLVPSNGSSLDDFGRAVDIDGDAVVVGSWSHDPVVGGNVLNYAGGAYVYRHDGEAWVEEAQLVASDAAAHDRFGCSVAICGDVAFVGAMTDTTTGSVYVFRFNGVDWIEEAKLVASDGEILDGFGTTISLEGDTAVIGASADDDGGFDAGAAYVFDFDGQQWSERDKLIAPDASAGDAFGFSVSLSGTRTCMGAWCVGDNGEDSGAAYVFALDSIPGDIDCDGDVDEFDLALVLGAWGPCAHCPEDVNGDGVVNVLDLLIVLANWT